MDNNIIDIKENYIYHLDKELLAILLKDRTTDKNIIWATDNYKMYGYGYDENDSITIEAITGYNGEIIKPRIEKTQKEQVDRIREKAEVFTPSWICNKQNNMIDNSWFGLENVFNTEVDKSWVATKNPIIFPTLEGKSWKDYIEDIRLEITCGEAPYLVSRYDTVSGEFIELPRRIGLLDRKLRVVSENAADEDNWIKWTVKSYKAIYGYDWQGDNVLLARENLLFTFIDYYKAKYNKMPDIPLLEQIAHIISWNIWQMDGLKQVIPNSCKKSETEQISLFDTETENEPCPGCINNDPFSHTGIYCIIKDWKANKNIPFVSLLKKK